MNFDAGVFTTQGVLDTLLRDGSLTPHTHPHSRKMFHKRASISVRPVLIAADQQERRWRSNNRHRFARMKATAGALPRWH